MAFIRSQRILLRSAARTAAIATSSVTNASSGNVAAIGPSYSYEGSTARFYLNVTAASGTGGLTLQIRGYDKVSGSAFVLASNGSAVTATGLYVFEIAPAIAAASGNRLVAFNGLLPVEWDINIAVGDSSRYTYSLSMEITG